MLDTLGVVMVTLVAYNFLLLFIGLIMWTTEGNSDATQTTGAGLSFTSGMALVLVGIVSFGIWLGGL